MNEMQNAELIPLPELLSDIIDNRGKTCPTVETGFPLIATNCIKNNKLYPVFENIRYVSDEVLETWFRQKLEPNDILFVNKGTPGKVCLVPNPVNFCAAQDMVAFRADSSKIYYRYLFCILKSDYIQKTISNFHVGVAIPHFKKEDLKQLLIPVPPMDLQIKIGDLYCTLFEKMNNNELINSELESMIKDIFGYWFLQFDFPNDEGKPFKSSGGEMVFNEEVKMNIPKGWTIGSLNDIAKYINGLACQKYRPIDENNKLPVIKITEMHEGFTDKTEFVRSDIDEKHIINDGDILFSWSATLETMIWAGGTGGLNQHIFKVVPKDYGKYYVYMMLSSYIINFVRMAESRKTTMGHITKDHLLQSKIVLPPKELTYEFDRLVYDLFEKYIYNNIENRELSSLKDYLLPLLMSGQVQFK